MCHILGNRVVEVSAMVSNLNPEEITVEDTAVLNLKFDSGVIGSMHAGYHMAGSNPGYAGGSYDNFLGIRGVGGYIRVPSATSDSYEIYTEVDGWVTEKLETREFASIPSDAYGGKVGEDFVSDFLKASIIGCFISFVGSSVIKNLQSLSATKSLQLGWFTKSLITIANTFLPL